MSPISFIINKILEVTVTLLDYILLFMIFLLTYIVLARYFFSWGDIAYQELVMYCHATIFMLGISYTLKEDSHVSIDIFSRKYSKTLKIKINLFLNIIFLIPISLFFIYISLDMVMNSWAIYEGSSEAGGLNYVYLLKSLIPLTGVLIFLTGLNKIILGFSELGK
tara:strand:- start:2402 stop:2896 length:495 start_codon:yes stop_codon:yes gene_type:complete